MSDNLVEMTIEIDQEVYDQAVALFDKLGTTIEAMTVAFMKFCIIPDNLPLLMAYLGKEKAPTGVDAKELHQRIFDEIYQIAKVR